MTDPRNAPPAVVPLRCLGGGGAPPELARDLKQIAALPLDAKKQLWRALGPSLGEPLPPDVERLLDQFCARHGLSADDFARSLKACRFLLREASRLDLAADAFAADVDALTGGSEEIRVVLLAGYDVAKALLRKEITRGALLDHGALLVGVEWRLDRVLASDRGVNLGAAVAVLTLRYEDGPRKERITLQALPETLRELRDACDRLLG